MKISDHINKPALKATCLFFMFAVLLSKSMVSAQTIQIYGTSFEKELKISDYQLQLKGTALLRYLVFI